MGPPNLWAATLIADRPLAAKSTGIWPTAWIASLCIGTSNSAATAANSAIGMMVPTSLLAHITETSATSSWSCRAARSAAGATEPSASTGSHVTSAPSCSTSHSTASRTAWCSTAVVTIRLRRGSASRRAQKMPLTARLSLSVPPAVKMTSDGRAPSSSASVSRDSSIRRRAARPVPCSEDALPTVASTAVIASMAAGCIGVVAA